MGGRLRSQSLQMGACQVPPLRCQTPGKHWALRHMGALTAMLPPQGTPSQLQPARCVDLILSEPQSRSAAELPAPPEVDAAAVCGGHKRAQVGQGVGPAQAGVADERVADGIPQPGSVAACGRAVNMQQLQACSRQHKGLGTIVASALPGATVRYIAPA